MRCVLSFAPFLARHVYKNILKVGQFNLFFALKARCYQLVNKMVGRINAYNMTAIHKGNTIAQLLGLVHIVSGNYYRSAAVADLADEIP